MKLFVNGGPRAARKLAAGTKLKTGANVLVGGGNRKGACFNGFIADVRVYNRALSEHEVHALSLPPGSDLIKSRLTDGERDAADGFFGKRRTGAEFRRSGRQLWLTNDETGIEVIQGKAGFYLSRFHGARAGREFLWQDNPQAREGLWRLVLRRDKGRDEAARTVTSNDGATIEYRSVKVKDGVTLSLQWKGMAVADEKGVLDVEVLMTLKNGDPFARWRINVLNRSKTWGLWTVVFPVLKLRPIGDDPTRNRFAIARAQGIMGRDPFNKPFFSPGKYPGTINMQFSALYNLSGSGLYLAMHDGDGHKKHLHNDPLVGLGALEYRAEHFPRNMGYAEEDYHMPYDFVMGPFDGDWYEACQIYRAWATEQRWCAKGPLAVRKDIPRWYKECPMVLVANSSRGDSEVITSRDYMLEFLKFIGTDLPVIWYTWKEHVPDRTHYNKEDSPWKVPDNRPRPCGNIHDGNYPAMPALKTFASACRAIAEAGGRVNPYVCSRIYDQGLEENAPLAAQAKPNVIRKVNGDIKFVERADVAWGMCYHTKWWQQRMAETVTELIRREHAGGIYFDTFYGGYFQCFDTRHGHSHGGGNHGYLGARKLSEIVRGAMKKADPESIMTGENPCETAIDLLDGYLYCDTIRPDGLPLFATVYGDYILRFGRRVHAGDEGFYMQCATLFLEGAQLGRLYVHQVGFLKKEHAGTEMEKRMLFLRKLGRYYRPEVAAKYLAYGRLLRPISFTTPDPMPTSSYNETYKMTWVLTRPSLMSGTFRAPNGDIGVFIINISDNPLRFSFELTPERYPIGKTRTYTVTTVSDPGNPNGIGSTHKGKIEYNNQIAARDVVLIEVKPTR